MAHIPPRKVLIAADHAGLELKSALQKRISDWNWIDLGPTDANRVDYPDYAELLARKVALGDAERGILVCGSGIGMCIAANKIPGIRAAVVESPTTARLAREHNDTNILCLGARILPEEQAVAIARIWLETGFTQEGRHQARIEKITALEKRK